MTVVRGANLIDIAPDDDDMLDGGEMKNSELSLDLLNGIAGGAGDKTIKTLKYLVSPGDTLKILAERFRTTVDAICQVNPGLGNGRSAILIQGSQINIPLKDRSGVPELPL